MNLVNKSGLEGVSRSGAFSASPKNTGLVMRGIREGRRCCGL